MSGHRRVNVPGNNSADDNLPGDNPGGHDPPGNNPKGNDPPEDNPRGNDPPEDNPRGNDPPEDNPRGNDPSGDNPTGNDPPGDNPRGNDPSGTSQQEASDNEQVGNSDTSDQEHSVTSQHECDSDTSEDSSDTSYQGDSSDFESDASHQEESYTRQRKVSASTGEQKTSTSSRPPFAITKEYLTYLLHKRTPPDLRDVPANTKRNFQFLLREMLADFVLKDIPLSSGHEMQDLQDEVTPETTERVKSAFTEQTRKPGSEPQKDAPKTDEGSAVTKENIPWRQFPGIFGHFTAPGFISPLSSDGDCRSNVSDDDEGESRWTGLCVSWNGQFLNASPARAWILPDEIRVPPEETTLYNLPLSEYSCAINTRLCSIILGRKMSPFEKQFLQLYALKSSQLKAEIIVPCFDYFFVSDKEMKPENGANSKEVSSPKIDTPPKAQSPTPSEEEMPSSAPTPISIMTKSRNEQYSYLKFLLQKGRQEADTKNIVPDKNVAANLNENAEQRQPSNSPSLTVDEEEDVKSCEPECEISEEGIYELSEEDYEQQCEEEEEYDSSDECVYEEGGESYTIDEDEDIPTVDAEMNTEAIVEEQSDENCKAQDKKHKAEISAQIKKEDLKLDQEDSKKISSESSTKEELVFEERHKGNQEETRHLEGLNLTAKDDVHVGREEISRLDAENKKDPHRSLAGSNQVGPGYEKGSRGLLPHEKEVSLRGAGNKPCTVKRPLSASSENAAEVDIKKQRVLSQGDSDKTSATSEEKVRPEDQLTGVSEADYESQTPEAMETDNSEKDSIISKDTHHGCFMTQHGSSKRDRDSSSLSCDESEFQFKVPRVSSSLGNLDDSMSGVTDACDQENSADQSKKDEQLTKSNVAESEFNISLITTPAKHAIKGLHSSPPKQSTRQKITRILFGEDSDSESVPDTLPVKRQSKDDGILPEVGNPSGRQSPRRLRKIRRTQYPGTPATPLQEPPPTPPPYIPLCNDSYSFSTDWGVIIDKKHFSFYGTFMRKNAFGFAFPLRLLCSRRYEKKYYHKIITTLIPGKSNVFEYLRTKLQFNVPIPIVKSTAQNNTHLLTNYGRKDFKYIFRVQITKKGEKSQYEGINRKYMDRQRPDSGPTSSQREQPTESKASTSSSGTSSKASSDTQGTTQSVEAESAADTVRALLKDYPEISLLQRPNKPGSSTANIESADARPQVVKPDLSISPVPNEPSCSYAKPTSVQPTSILEPILRLLHAIVFRVTEVETEFVFDDSGIYGKFRMLDGVPGRLHRKFYMSKGQCKIDPLTINRASGLPYASRNDLLFKSDEPLDLHDYGRQVRENLQRITGAPIQPNARMTSTILCKREHHMQKFALIFHVLVVAINNSASAAEDSTTNMNPICSEPGLGSSTEASGSAPQLATDTVSSDASSLGSTTPTPISPHTSTSAGSSPAAPSSHSAAPSSHSAAPSSSSAAPSLSSAAPSSSSAAPSSSSAAPSSPLSSSGGSASNIPSDSSQGTSMPSSPEGSLSPVASTSSGQDQQTSPTNPLRRLGFTVIEGRCISSDESSETSLAPVDVALKSGGQTYDLQGHMVSLMQKPLADINDFDAGFSDVIGRITPSVVVTARDDNGRSTIVYPGAKKKFSSVEEFELLPPQLAMRLAEYLGYFHGVFTIKQLSKRSLLCRLYPELFPPYLRVLKDLFLDGRRTLISMENKIKHGPKETNNLRRYLFLRYFIQGPLRMQELATELQNKHHRFITLVNGCVLPQNVEFKATKMHLTDVKLKSWCFGHENYCIYDLLCLIVFCTDACSCQAYLNGLVLTYIRAFERVHKLVQSKLHFDESSFKTMLEHCCRRLVIQMLAQPKMFFFDQDWFPEFLAILEKTMHIIGDYVEPPAPKTSISLGDD